MPDLTLPLVVTLPNGDTAMLTPLEVTPSTPGARALLSCALPGGATLEIDRDTGERRLRLPGQPADFCPDLSALPPGATPSPGYLFARRVDAVLAAVLPLADGDQLAKRAAWFGENPRSYAAIMRGRPVSTDKVRAWVRTLNDRQRGPQLGYREESGHFRVWLEGWRGDPFAPAGVP